MSSWDELSLRCGSLFRQMMMALADMRVEERGREEERDSEVEQEGDVDLFGDAVCED